MEPARPTGVALGDRIEHVPLADLRPAVVNDELYKPVRTDDPAIIELGRDIARKGLLEPIVATPDGVIVSGHRRRAGAEVADLDVVPVRRINIRSTDPRFVEYLTSFNRQRVKSAQEQVREAVVRTSPDDARNVLLAHRAAEVAREHRRIADTGLRVIAPTAASRRSVITDQKRPMLDAARAVVEQYRGYWPLTLRQIHYRLLTRNVLRNARTKTKYVNTHGCYQDLSDLLSRARVAGDFPWEAMHDPTRPRVEWRQWDSVAPFLQEQIHDFGRGYKRNLLRSQPSYVELVVEKVAALDIAERAAGPFHVPVGVGKGYTSVTSLDETADRFHASGKDHFLMLVAGDLDPEGENITEVWGACLRDEHGVENLTVVKVGVNPAQVAESGLSPLPVKDGSSRKDKFVRAHGSSVYELEAFEPDQLQAVIRDAIRGVLDMALFAGEQRIESDEARYVVAYQQQVAEALKHCRVGGGEA
ncbi:ParB N-terminal domain-containing protein [Urbifossiella limnaea]|uniref:ParB-like nuclease domain protein n=1 Tax=Urbifossiella limnaea TaxID=2528023 RepID=A0A517XWD7_9BACT|nr:ParB N-terminal domain-containing protein [Urbifossiella limnaea]QDU21823.1 ParB-like nuclease domain protein [Urbifossiella limnaea]